MRRILLVIVIFMVIETAMEGVNILPQLIIPFIIFYLFMRTLTIFRKYQKPYESGRDRYKKVMAKSKRR